MKVRVQIAPPARGGATGAHLRHRLASDVAEVHPRADGETYPLDAAFRSASASRSAGASYPVLPRSLGLQQHDRHAVVDTGDLEAVHPIDDGARRQQRAAARARDVDEVDRNRGRRAGHAIDPCSPSYSTAARRGTRARPRCSPVFSMWMRTASRIVRGTSPFSIANGPTPARMLPQFWLSLTSPRSTTTCRNR